MARRELDRRMPAVDGFALVLGRLSNAVDANWERAGDASDPEGLHDLRVALRRTRAVLRAGRTVLPAAMADEADGFLRSLTAATGPARDLDVLVEDLDAALGPCREAVHAERAAARAELVALLDGASATAWRQGWQEVIAAAAIATEPGEHAHRRLGRVVARRLEQAQHDVLEAGRRLGPDTPDSVVHELRKDARRLRYLLECFAALAPGRERRFVERLKTFQSVLGRHQDLVVQLGFVERVATDQGAVAGLAEQLEHRRDDARSEFAASFADYDTERARRAFDRLADHVRGRSH